MWGNLKKIVTESLFLVVLIYPSSLKSQGIVKDQIIDTIRCRNAKGQTYALFVPAQYENQKSWPVILIFDPAARGKEGISNFIEAGRKYGFILACSNNSRNGPLENNFTAAEEMLRDVEERFTIDQRRIYVAGFSGGSRFAAALAVVNNKISGVIGCGAGLLNNKGYFPTVNSQFLYYGIAGTRDMNYLEMRDLPEYFNNNSRITSYFRSFPGGHQWPGSDLITDAVEWLILKSMNSGIITSDQDFISYLQNKTQDLINSLISAGNLVEADMYMRFSLRDFQGTIFTSRIANLINDTEKSADFRNAIRKWNRVTESEKQKRETYLNYLNKILNSGSLPDSASVWWNKEAMTLLRIRDRASPENSQMASRLLNFISILCYEQGALYYRNKLFAQSSFLFKICTFSDSENQNNYYNLARSLAGQGKVQESVGALSGAINHGFNSRKIVESDPVFSKISDNPGFRSLMLKMK